MTVRADRRRVGVLYHPRVEASRPLAEELVARLGAAGAEASLLSAWEEKGGLGGRLGDLDWLVVMGGDGSLVRVGRLAADHDLPVIGVNFGRLGFLAEIRPDEALSRIPALLDGSGTLEERLMLRVQGVASGWDLTPMDAVNDVFVGRGRVARAVRLAVAVDGTPVMHFTADGLVVSSPTGSTAYAMSAGGPVVPPGLDVLVFAPVVPHPLPVRTLVLPPTAVVDVTIQADEGAVLSVDGQLHHDLVDGDTLRVTAGPRRLRLLRAGPTSQFYSTLIERLRRW
jgi:NAD+ kinase